MSILTRMNREGESWWPSLCRLCRRWQRHPLCDDCVQQAGLGRARCYRCGLCLVFPDGQCDNLCSACNDMPPEFDHTVTPLDYQQPWSSLIAALKFRHDPRMAHLLAALMVPAIRERWAVRTPPGRPSARPVLRPGPGRLRTGAPTLVVAVPLSAARLRERGYNQAWLLAREVARSLDLPTLPDLLTRTRHTDRLMGLEADERARHIKGAFTVNPAWAGRVVGRHVAVVDDVLTTGATLNEVARLLWQSGAREISVWVAARTPAPDSQS